LPPIVSGYQLPVPVPADRLGNEDAADEGMPLMAGILLRAAGEALLAASSTALFLFWVRPELQRRRASRLAFAVAVALALVVPVRLLMASLVPVPFFVLVGSTMLLVAVRLFPGVLIRVTGGARPMAPAAEAILQRINLALGRYEAGDPPGATAQLEQLNALRTPDTERYIDLWLRYVEEERARRKGIRESSSTTLRQIGEEAERLTPRIDPPEPRRAWAVVGLAALIGAGPALIAARACISVETLLPTSASEEILDGSLPVTPALKSQPEPGATILYDAPWDLEAAAEARHDPDTRAQLVEAGFVRAHATIWRATDGFQLSSDVFVFRDAAGALSFHRDVNRYACQFSNEAFSARNGIGLQVRWSSGDRIVEQISWVSGPRRYVVSVGALSPPADHSRVRRLADHVLRDIGT